jgi:signal transduction histidine kinase
VAFDLDKTTDQVAWFFTSSIQYVIGSYLVFQLLAMNLHFTGAYLIMKGLIRLYLMIAGLFLLLSISRRRKIAYYNYLAAGGICMIVCGLISSIVNIMKPDPVNFGAVSWLLVGFFLDVVFFSSAIGYRIRAEYLEKEATLKALFEKESELKLKELEKVNAIYKTREAERQRIARDLHDETGATLTSISFLSEVVKQQFATGHENTLQTLDKIGEHSRRMIEEISDSVWAINPANDQFGRITDRMQNFALPLLAAANIQLHFTAGEELKTTTLSMEQRKNLYLIFKEAINNAVKYSACSSIVIHLHVADGLLIMEIHDNGRGFDKINNRRGNGLSNMQSRADEINARLVIHSTAETGTSLSLQLPVTQNT